jgi:hypothetical protein
MDFQNFNSSAGIAYRPRISQENDEYEVTLGLSGRRRRLGLAWTRSVMHGEERGYWVLAVAQYGQGLGGCWYF